MTKIWDKVKSFFNPVLSDSEKIESMKSDRYLTITVTWLLTLLFIYLIVLASFPVEFSGEVVIYGDGACVIDVNNKTTTLNELNKTITFKGDFKVPYRFITKEILSLNEDL